MECAWCGDPSVKETVKDCYWIMPDGRRSLNILRVPAVECPNCGVHVTEEMNGKVEEALYLADLSGFPDELSYEDILKAPKIPLFHVK